MTEVRGAAGKDAEGTDDAADGDVISGLLRSRPRDNSFNGDVDAELGI